MLLLFIDNERTESPTSSPRSLLACKDLTVPFLQECCLLSPLHPKDNLGSKVSQAAQGTAVIITHLLWWCVKQDSGRGRMWWLRLSARWCSPQPPPHFSEFLLLQQPILLTFALLSSFIIFIKSNYQKSGWGPSWMDFFFVSSFHFAKFVLFCFLLLNSFDNKRQVTQQQKHCSSAWTAQGRLSPPPENPEERAYAAAELELHPNHRELSWASQNIA